METKPLFSIIIPTLNEERFLPRLLQDLTNQTTSNFEVIHVDGKSDDRTVQLAKKFAKKLPKLIQITSPIRNVSHQRNQGAKVAKGKYLLFIDADTQLPHYFLEGLSFQLHRKPADMFTTWSIPDSNKTADKTFITIVNLALDVSQIIESPIAVGVLMGITPKGFKQVGGFRQDVKFGEDEDLVKTGHKKGLSFAVYHQPKFVYSLRRFRTEGSLPTIQQIAAKRLRAITNGKLIKPKDYLMGGHVFKEHETDKSIFNKIDTALKKSVKQPKIKQFLKDLITFQKLDR